MCSIYNQLTIGDSRGGKLHPSEQSISLPWPFRKNPDSTSAILDCQIHSKIWYTFITHLSNWNWCLWVATQWVVELETRAHCCCQDEPPLLRIWWEEQANRKKQVHSFTLLPFTLPSCVLLVEPNRKTATKEKSSLHTASLSQGRIEKDGFGAERRYLHNQHTWLG